MRSDKFIYVAVGAFVLLNFPHLAMAQDGLAQAGAYESKGFAGGIFIDAICDLYGLVGGSLGALLTSSALIMGLVAAATGGFQSLRSAVIVGVGAFGMSSLVSLYFGQFNCQ